MKSVVEPKRETPVTYKTDVLVVGGGSAGFAAALASTRVGAKTMLIERYGCLGGLMTGGLVTTIAKVDDGINGELVSGLELVDAVVFRKNGGLIIDPEFAKWTMDGMLQSEHVELLFYTFAVSVILNRDMIKAIIIENKSGRQAIEVATVVDATGDGDIAALSGVPFLMGDKKGRTRPITSMFLIQDVAKNTPKSYFKSTPRRFADTFIGLNTELRDGEMFCWAGNIEGVNGLNSEQLTKAEIAIRRKSCEWMMHARKNVLGCENAFISQIASQVGVRETRRIVGVYTLKAQDWKDKVQFKDAIGLMRMKEEIPFGCLVPQKVGNLVVVGRCASYGEDVFDEMRGVASCITTGQAGGVAAALACREGVSFGDLDIEVLRRTLRKQGVEF